MLLKLAVPGGYMIGADHGRVTIELCSGVAVQPAGMAMPAMHGGVLRHGKPQDHGGAAMPCAYSGLSAASLGAIDPVLVAALIAFVMMVGLSAVTRPAIPARGYLRPPLRGPPATL